MNNKECKKKNKNIIKNKLKISIMKNKKTNNKKINNKKLFQMAIIITIMKSNSSFHHKNKKNRSNK